MIKAYIILSKRRLPFGEFPTLLDALRAVLCLRGNLSAQSTNFIIKLNRDLSLEVELSSNGLTFKELKSRAELLTLCTPRTSGKN